MYNIMQHFQAYLFLLTLFAIGFQVAVVAASNRSSDNRDDDLIECTDGMALCFSHDYALGLLTRHGIRVHSSGSCSDRLNGTCTSLQQIRAEVIVGVSGVIQLARKLNCSIVVTGGTEMSGSGQGYRHHWHGWLLNLRRLPCLLDYIENELQPLGNNDYCDETGVEYHIAANRVDAFYGRPNKCNDAVKPSKLSAEVTAICPEGSRVQVLLVWLCIAMILELTTALAVVAYCCAKQKRSLKNLAPLPQYKLPM